MSETTGLRENRATPEGRELGMHLARFCDQEIVRSGRDDRCSTCAFRTGDHIANGSPETLMSAFKCIMERTPFWCHEHDRACAGWAALIPAKGDEVAMPWEHVDGQ
jgi:hypothetical protein